MSFIFRECVKFDVTCMDVYSIVSLREWFEWRNTPICEQKIELEKNDGVSLGYERNCTITLSQGMSHGIKAFIL